MNNNLSQRDRKALGPEYRYYRREKLEGEAPPATRAHQPWVPMRDLAWQLLRPGAGDAAVLPRRGMQT